jgi:ADP-heptose:LPS heptosyltransferase
VAFTRRGLSGLATLGVEVSRASWPAQIRTMFETVTGSRDESPLRPRIYLDAAEQRGADAAWSDMPLGDAPLTIAAAITTRQHVGLFPPDLFADILRMALALEPNARVVLAGSAGDADVLQATASMIGSRVIVRAGTWPLRTFAGVLARCDAFLGADSGPRHIANAMDIPALFVRNMSVPEVEAGRYCDTEIDLAPAGQYLSTDATRAALATVDRRQAAADLVAPARRRADRRTAGAD